MTFINYLTAALILQYAALFVGYAVTGDLGRALYWAGALIITVGVTIK